MASPGQLALIVGSYQRLTGRQLISRDTDIVTGLRDAPRAILAHGTQPDPVFFYGNALALDLFGLSFERFTAMPSRLSAEPLHRDERAALLARVARDNFIDDYAGVRISSAGRRFRIEQATVWNLVAADGTIHGQAATFDRWTMLD